MDTGNFTGNPTPAGRAQTRVLLQGMERLGYSVVNVGERDLRQGYDVFTAATEGLNLRFVSSNIVDKATGKPIFEPSLVLDAPSPDESRRMKLGVVGAARFNPIFSKEGPGGVSMVVAHPVEQVRQQVLRLQEQDVDLVVLLAALSRDDARKIVRAVRGIDFVIGAYGGYFTRERESEERTWLVYSGNQGMRLAETRVYLGAEGQVTDQRTALHLMSEIYPADQEMLEFVGAAEIPQSARAAVLRLPESVKTDGPFLGVAACSSCHAEAARQWESTGHATALETLEAARKDGELQCLVCHTTGAGVPGGFASREEHPELASVGCETCHGPGRRHLRDTSKPYGEISLGTCTICHDRKNSPKFDYYSDLIKVSHEERKPQ